MAKMDRYPDRPTDSNPATGMIAPADDETEIDLIELMLHLLSQTRLILLVAFLGIALAAVYTFFIVTPMYEATAKLYVVNSKDSALNLSDLQIGSYLASDYTEVFKTWEVHEMVIRNLGLRYTYKELQERLAIENPTNTRILYITFQSASAREAAAVANEYATVAIKYIADTMSTEEPNIMSVALEPVLPSSPNKTRNLLLGLLLGLVCGIGWVTVRFILDDKIKSVDDIRKYSNMPVLAVVPLSGSASGKKGHYAKRSDKK